MRIGVDATCWGNKRGFGRFTRELLDRVLELDTSNEYLFFVDSSTPEADSIPPSARKIVGNTKVSPMEAASANGRRSLRDIWSMTSSVMRHELDVFFFPAVYSYFPIVNRTKLVVTIHDMIADRHPDLIFPNAKLKLFWKLKQLAAVKQAHLIATVSEYSKAQIAEYFHLEDSRIRIISEAAQPIFAEPVSAESVEEALGRFGVRPRERFLLYVGGISPHKNLETLVRAFEMIKADTKFSDLKLVFVGDYKDDPFFSAYPRLKEQVSVMRLTDDVIFTGFMPDEDLARFYAAAEALVFPSLEEGFGLPAIEAMSSGTPVAASNCSSLPEILGAAGKYFDPKDARSMADSVGEILASGDLARSMRDAGKRRAKEFTWEKAALQTIAIFKELANSSAKDRTAAISGVVTGPNNR